MEGMLPGNVGVVVTSETDNKARTLTEVRHALKDAGGRDTSAAFLFEKKGRVVFAAFVLTDHYNEDYFVKIPFTIQ